MIILGIETSCDDTGIALIECNKDKKCHILSNVISSQIEVHAPYGGVVPNLAARAHLENIKPCLEQALKEAGNPEIDLIAVTRGPGLIPCLLVGVNFAKALAYSLNKPILGVSHLEGHLYANLINNPKVNFPTLCLIVSGGHTQLVLMKDHGQYQLLGETRDDATGEAFDKVAKLLGLGYPGGPAISQLAEKYKKQDTRNKIPASPASSADRPVGRQTNSKSQTPNLKFPRPMIDSKNYDFSFSGLKTAVLYQVKKLPKITPKLKMEICYEFEKATVDVLISKTVKAAREFKVKTIMISGGVAANKRLREEMAKKVKKELPQVELRIPEISFCTDNAVMIAIVARYKKRKTQPNSWASIQADANLRLT